MKKIFFSLFVFFISVSVFAGGWFQDFSSEVISIIDEGDATTPPDDAEWYFTGTTSVNPIFQTKNVQTVWKNSTSWNLGTNFKPAGKFVYLNGTSGLINSVDVFSLVSPAFTPTTNASELYYRIQEIKVSNEYDGPEELYVEVATKIDDVWTWTTSTTNVLAGLSGYNVSTTPVTVLQESLNSYANQEIKIRFRGKINRGNFVAVIYDVALVDNAVTDLAVSAPQNITSQIPKKHAGQVLNASVQNLGKAVAADDAVTLTATTTGYSATANVPALQPLATTTFTAFASPFTPQSFGEYQFQYALSDDDNGDNNTASSNTFTITPNTFALDTGFVYGTAGSTSLDLGNKFTLAVEDSIESISVGWGKLGSEPSSLKFQLVIYAVDADGVSGTEPVYTSDTLIRPANAATPPNGRLATFESYPVNLKLPAGDYVFAVRSTVNIGIGTNYDNNSVYYGIDKTTKELTSTAGQYLLIRVNTASDITFSPAVGSKTAGINEPIVIEGTAVTGLAASPAITVKKGAVEVADVTASFANGKITITHAAFEYNTTYTVTVPANTITGYASALSWSFTTIPSLTPKTFVPTNGGSSIALDATVSVTFDRNIPDGSTLAGITIATDSESPDAVSDVSATKDGAVLTIAHAPFERNTKYKVTIPATAIEELAADTSWVFTTVPPVGLATNSPLTPANEEVDVSLTTPVWVVFNQSIDTAGSTLAGITINDNPVTASWSSPGGVANSRLNIDRSNLTFQENTLYTVIIPVGAVPGYSEAITWSFTTFVPLETVAYTPVSGSEDVPVDTEISIEFNKGNFSLHGFTPTGQVSITPTGGTPLSGVTYEKNESQKKLIISHTDPLLPSTEYTINVTENAIPDYAGINNWTFTTAELALEIVSFTPENGAEDVSVGHLVEVTFNKTIDTLSTAGIRINGAAPTGVALGSSTGYTKNKLRLNHAAFSQATEYTVTIPSGSIAGYDGDISWTFTTVPVLDWTPSPAKNAAGVTSDAPLKIKFNRAPLRPRQLGSPAISITGNNGETITVDDISWNTAGDIVTINHAPFDTAHVTYTVNVVATSIIDGADWTSESSSIAWSFTTTDLTYTTSPENNATGVALDALLQITFNRAPTRYGWMDAVSPRYLLEGGSLVLPGNPSWSADGTVLTFPHGDFASNVTYTVKVATASIINEGYSATDTIVWSFTTINETGLQKPSEASGVYPTLTKGDITVISEPGSLIKITDISGAVSTSFRSVGRQTPVYLKGASGLYLVTVANGKSTSVHKVVLSK